MTLLNKSVLSFGSVTVLATVLLWPDQNPIPINDNTPADTAIRNQDPQYKSPFKTAISEQISALGNKPLLEYE